MTVGKIFFGFGKSTFRFPDLQINRFDPNTL